MEIDLFGEKWSLGLALQSKEQGGLGLGGGMYATGNGELTLSGTK